MDRFPSIPHLSFSPQINDDDIVCNESTQTSFVGNNVIIHEKMDGGNCCIFGGNVYARTHKHIAKHPWFDTIKILIKSQPLFYESPYFDELMIFGENMTAIHSIKYNALTSYFYIFAVYNIKTKVWYSIDDVVDISKKLNLPNPPLLFNGVFNSMNDIKKWMNTQIKKPSILGSKHREGFVIRCCKEIKSTEFDKYYAKYVRKGHIQTDKNWTKTWKKVKLIEVTERYNNDDNDNDEHKVSHSKSQGKNKGKHKQKHKSKKKKNKGSVTLKTSFIVCVGLPGSGKSSFSEHLCQHRAEWNRAGTDLFKAQQQQQNNNSKQRKFKRNKDAVFDFISRKIKQREKVIVENCNMTKDKRLELLDCAFKPKDSICIHFDIDKMECIKRTKQRQHHETDKLFHSNRGNKIIESFAKSFQTPDKKEGFKQIIVIKNDNDINALLKKLGVNQPLIIKNKDGSNHDDENDIVEEENKTQNENQNVNEHKNEEKIICKKKHKKIEDNLYHSKMAKSRFAMNLKKVCKKLDLEIDKILNCYIYGSRVYGTGNSKSNWNIIIVYDEDINDIKNTRRSIENIDAWIMDKKQWNQQLLIKFNFKVWLMLFLPLEAIWKNELKIDWKNKFDQSKFIQQILFEIEKDCKKINNFSMKNKMDRVHKIFIHSLRMIEISKQMIQLISNNIDDDNVKDFVGLINFNEIEALIKSEQKELSMNDKNNNSKDIWINTLRNKGAEIEKEAASDSMIMID